MAEARGIEPRRDFSSRLHLSGVLPYLSAMLPCLAPGRGFEPRSAGPRPAVLPLNEPGSNWWTGRASNPQPSACGADALPIELRGPGGSDWLRTSICRLKRTVLYLLSYGSMRLVGEEGIEPPISWSQAKRLATRLFPKLEGPVRIELTRSRLRGECSANVSYRPERSSIVWRRVKDSNLHGREAVCFQDRGDTSSATTLRARYARDVGRVVFGDAAERLVNIAQRV
jgi:hypothetical protein